MLLLKTKGPCTLTGRNVRLSNISSYTDIILMPQLSPGDESHAVRRKT